jgi:EmrB/QacA subfamily drug resistance transporter
VAISTTGGLSSAEAKPFTIGSVLMPLLAIIVGIFMVVLDSTAINVALPRLVVDFHDKLSTVQWTVTGYALAQAAVIPLAGWLSDRFGAKQVFLISVALFTIGSVLCATAQSSGMLIAFRILQGMGGGFVVPIAMAYTYRLSPPEKVGVLMGMMGVPILFAPAIGPVLAGWLVQYQTWRWIFLINLPIGLIGLLIGIRSLPPISRQAVAGLDIPGFILAPVAFASLCYGISEGSSSWTSVNTIGGIVVGLVALALFAVAELRAEAPLLELRVFRSRDFSLGIPVQWVTQFALFGVLFLIPYFLQTVRGYGAFDTGLTLLPQALGAGLAMPIGGILFDRFGARPLVISGGVLIVIASVILTRLSLSTSGRDVILPLALSGVGMGLIMMPLNTHLINAAPRKLVSRVTSLTNALQQVINSLTIASLATILTSHISTNIANARLGVIARFPNPAHLSAGAAAAMKQQMQAAIAQASVSAFNDTFKVLVIMAVAGTAMGVVLRRNVAAQAAQPATEAAQSAAMHMA